MSLECVATVKCDGCGIAKTKTVTSVKNELPKMAADTFDPSGAMHYHRDQFVAYGYAKHLCGRCANAAARAMLHCIQDLRRAGNAGS